MKKLTALFLSVLLAIQVGGGLVAAAEEPEEIVTLHMLGGVEQFDPTTDITREKIRERLGIDIIAEMGNDPDKINLILSSGEEYDIIKGIGRAMLTNLIRTKTVTNLSPYIDQYPDLLEMFAPEYWDGLTGSDGNIYAIANQNLEDVDSAIAVRNDWMEALGLEDPSTLDEFVDMLIAFRDNNPDGLPPEQVIPFSFQGDSNTFSLNGLTQAFGIGASPLDFIDVDGSLVPGLATEGGKAYIEFLNRLYSEGLLDADFAANSYSILEQRIGSGFIGAAAMSCWVSNSQQALRAEGDDHYMRFIEPLVNEDGERKIATRGGYEQTLIVPRASEKADVVVRFAYEFLQPENYVWFVIGDEDVHYTINEEGRYMAILPAFNELNLARWFFPINQKDLYQDVFSARAYKVKEMGMMWDQVNETCQSYGYINPLAYCAITTDMEKYTNSITIFAQEKLMRMVLDANELADYDAFVQEYMDRGGAALMQAYNEWYQK